MKIKILRDFRIAQHDPSLPQLDFKKDEIVNLSKKIRLANRIIELGYGIEMIEAEIIIEDTIFEKVEEIEIEQPEIEEKDEYETKVITKKGRKKRGK